MGLIRRFGVIEKPDCPYECKRCETAFSVQYQVCPECGGYSVEREEWD
jgi:ribosomal protein L37E